MASKYPIVDIYHAHRAQGVERERLLRQAKYKLDQEEGQTFTLWRKGWKAQVEEITLAEKQWLDHVINLSPLSEALNSMQGKPLSFGDWLSEAIEKQWVLGAFNLIEP